MQKLPGVPANSLGEELSHEGMIALLCCPPACQLTLVVRIPTLGPLFHKLGLLLKGCPVAKC